MQDSAANNQSTEDCLYCFCGGRSDFDEQLSFRIDLFLSIVNTYYAFSSLLANGLVIYIFYKTPSLFVPQNILLCCLAVIDFITGLTAQPLFVILLVSRLAKACKIYMIVEDIFVIMGYGLTALSLMTITLAGIEKSLALYFPLRYPNIVTTSRLLAAELLAAAICFSGTLSAKFHHDRNHTVFKVFDVFEMSFIVLVNLVSFSYIHKVIRKAEKYIDSQWAIGSRLHDGIAVIKTTKKASRTMEFMSALSVICFTPHFIATLNSVFLREMTNSFMIIEEFSITAMFVLATINPLLYSYRMENIRRPLRNIVSAIIASLQAFVKFK